MLGEQETTMMLRMQRRLREHFGVEVDTVKRRGTAAAGRDRR